MTPKEILDSFSATLMQDERILSAQERALLTTLLQHAKTAAGRNRETQDAVRAVIAGAVGETVAHRAFSVLGENLVEQILDHIPPVDRIRQRSGCGDSRCTYRLPLDPTFIRSETGSEPGSTPAARSTSAPGRSQADSRIDSWSAATAWATTPAPGRPAEDSRSTTAIQSAATTRWDGSYTGGFSNRHRSR